MFSTAEGEGEEICVAMKDHASELARAMKASSRTQPTAEAVDATEDGESTADDASDRLGSSKPGLSEDTQTQERCVVK